MPATIMSDVFFQELEMPRPDFNLGVGSGSPRQQTAGIMLELEPVILETKPDLVLVYGDVNSTLAAALVCLKLGIGSVTSPVTPTNPRDAIGDCQYWVAQGYCF